jgi:hypothetical protein
MPFLPQHFRVTSEGPSQVNTGRVELSPLPPWVPFAGRAKVAFDFWHTTPL